MNVLVDRLAQAKARPLLVELAVRTALRDAIAWRIGGGTAPNADAFAVATVAAARQSLDALAADGAERSRALAAARSAANRLMNSALGRRLMAVPASQFVRLPVDLNGPDALVRDRRRRLHVVALKLRPDALEAGRTATAIALSTTVPLADRLAPLNVHVFSLVTGRRYLFERDVTNAAIGVRVA